MLIKRTIRAIALAAALLLVAAPAYAHDAVAGEELSQGLEILAISFAILGIGAFVCFWAWRRGQFNNVEEPKFTMLLAESELDYSFLELPEDEEDDLPAAAPIPTTKPQYASVETSSAAR